MDKYGLYAVYWEADQTLVVVMERGRGAGAPGPAWRRSGQPLRDGRHAYVLRLPDVRPAPPPGAPPTSLADLGIRLP